MGYYTKFSPVLAQSYAPQSAAYFAAMTTQLDSLRKQALDKCIKGFITDGLFSKLDYAVVHALVAEQQTLVSFTAGNPILVKVGTPTFTTKVGWTGVSSDASRLETPVNYNTFTNFQQNSASFGTFLTGTVAGTNTTCMGTSDALNIITPNYLSAHKYGRVNMSSNSSLSAGQGGNGLQAINRSTSTAFDLYRNGTSHNTGSLASSAPTAVKFNILTANLGVPAACTHAFTFIGGSLTGSEHLALYNRVNTLLTELAAIP